MYFIKTGVIELNPGSWKKAFIIILWKKHFLPRTAKNGRPESDEKLGSLPSNLGTFVQTECFNAKEFWPGIKTGWQILIIFNFYYWQSHCRLRPAIFLRDAPSVTSKTGICSSRLWWCSCCSSQVCKPRSPCQSGSFARRPEPTAGWTLRPPRPSRSPRLSPAGSLTEAALFLDGSSQLTAQILSGTCTGFAPTSPLFFIIRKTFQIFLYWLYIDSCI